MCTATACTSISIPIRLSRRALVLKTKPMMMFMNMLFQKQVGAPPTEPAPGGVGFEPRHFEENHNHAG
ncbi:MAG: hypothetical protein WA191_21280 [Telluria sp.]